MHPDLKEELEVAEEAERSENFFQAACFYKIAATIALKKQDSQAIKLCKRKIVEMNKKLIASGKDFQEFSGTYEISKEKLEAEERYIQGFLGQKDVKVALRMIGEDPRLTPQVKEVEKVAQKSTPVSLVLANLSAISVNGHLLKGGHDPAYFWFMGRYDDFQRFITNRYIFPIIHRLMENEKLDIKELSEHFSESGIFEKENLKIILVGLGRYFEKDYVSALHILVPQFEGVFLQLSEKLGISTTAIEQRPAVSTQTTTLSDHYLDTPAFENVWGKNLCRQIKFILFEQMGYKIRHKIAHGEIDPEECNFSNTTLVLYLYLVLLARVKRRSSESISHN